MLSPPPPKLPKAKAPSPIPSHISRENKPSSEHIPSCRPTSHLSLKDLPPPPPRPHSPPIHSSHESRPTVLTVREFSPPTSPLLPPPLPIQEKTATATSPQKEGDKPENEVEKAGKLETSGEREKLKFLYTVPSWAAAHVCAQNSCNFYFEVIRSGVILDKIPLQNLKPSKNASPMKCQDNYHEQKRSYLVFGRAPDVDVVLEHPSISRYHAIIQHGKHPATISHNPVDVYLYDLSSTHATYVNKKKCPQRQYIRLALGDCVSFGDSTRLYHFCGDLSVIELQARTEREDKILSAHRIYQAEKKKQHDLSRNQNLPSSSSPQADQVTWGIQEDASDEDDDNVEDNGIVENNHSHSGKYQSLNNYDQDIVDELSYMRGKKKPSMNMDSSIYERTDLSAKQIAKRDQLVAKRHKFANMLKEIDHIRSKETGMVELTEGQRQRLTFLSQRIKELEIYIEEAENALRENLTIRSKSTTHNVDYNTVKPSSPKADLDLSDESQDEFHDRTQQKDPGQFNFDSVETKESLATKIKALLNEFGVQQREVEAIKSGSAPRNKAAQADEEDELEKFMHENDKNIEKEKLRNMTKKIDDIKRQLKQVCKMYEIASNEKVTLDALLQSAEFECSENREGFGTKFETKPAQSQSGPDSGRFPPMEPTVIEKKPSEVEKFLRKTFERNCDERIGADGERTAKTSTSAKLFTESDQKKKRRLQGPFMGPTKLPRYKLDDEDIDESKPSEDQNGDEKTRLNEKYGY